MGNTPRSAHIIPAVLIGLLFCVLPMADTDAQVVPDSKGNPTTDEIAGLKSEVERLRGLIPSQSHAMIDVAYHFTNLWFAGQHENWQLAQFYFNEARQHIIWAIRIIPVRKSSAGDVKLQEIFEAFDRSMLTEIQKEIAAKDRKRFGVAYRQALEGCNGCHAASEKPFLHVRVPDQPEVRILEFNPQADKVDK